jgi:ketosteroid isomerase-like protein
MRQGTKSRGMVLEFDGETIVRARTYLDSAMVARRFEENPIG